MSALVQAAELAPSLGQALDGVFGALLRGLPPETASTGNTSSCARLGPAMHGTRAAANDFRPQPIRA